LEFKDFVQSVSDSKQPLPSGFDGLRAVQMAYGVYESSRLGKKVKIWGKEEEKLLELLKRG
jgi:predicted dehydrogenase